MPTLDDQLANQIANIENSTGRSLDDWLGLIRDSGIEKHSQIVAWLKDGHGLTYGNANLLALRAREAAAGGAPTDSDLISSHYAGKNAPLRTLYDDVVAEVKRFGSDIELDPKKSYVSLRRKKQFATVGPAAGQIEIGVNLPGAAATARLKEADGMCSHKVRIADPAGLDAELVGWLQEAYDRAG